MAVAGLDDFEKNVNIEFFEGYNSHPNDEFVNDLETENEDAKVARLIKSNPLKQFLGIPIKFEVEHTHDDVYSLRALLTDYAIQKGFNYNKRKNDRNRLTYACKKNGCPWRFHASSLIDNCTLQIKTYNNKHLCHRLCKSEKARAKWIASKFEVLVKKNPDIKCGVVSNLLRDEYNVIVDAQRLYKVKKRPPHVLCKEHVMSFRHLRKYTVMVQPRNTGSTAYIHLLEPTIIFQRFFISFEAHKKGFIEGCRPFIEVDGCHLKGPYGRVLLSAIALYSNNGLYPLACCIYEGEKVSTWSWFLEQLCLFLKYPEDKPICFMSDRQKGVVGALSLIGHIQL
ncbi:hypothetical protein Ddye_012323 [Dipteronia dyeriana]|uniref:Transposase n=1 Tax=Dipteronia dyeriana TaxID=168575 RepID=A0AAE0CII3_9ROSI|nr:hypothetical protein Ddye_012323 [Dipteronia dyeriana]